MTDIFISARRGAGAPAEILYGTVTFKPTLAHSRSTSLVLPAPTTYDLVSGQVVATNVQPTPEPVAGQIEWAYEVTFKDRHCKTYSFLVGVPDSTTQVNFISLPRYFETKPPLFGQGPQGDPGEAATVAVGSVAEGTEASVTNSGTSADAVLDFVLPQGPQGIPGEGVPAGGSALQVIRKNAGNTTTEWASLTKALVGLGNVDNTSDASKPVSTPQKTYIDQSNTLGYSSKLASDLPNTYPEGVTVGLFRVQDGWPQVEGGNDSFTVIKTDVPRQYAMATQWAYAYKPTEALVATDTPIMSRQGFGALGWGEWQTLASRKWVSDEVGDATSNASLAVTPFIKNREGVTSIESDGDVYAPKVVGEVELAVAPDRRFVDGVKFFAPINVGKLPGTWLDQWYGYIVGHDSPSIWLMTAPSLLGPWTYQEAVIGIPGSGALTTDSRFKVHTSSPEVMYRDGKIHLYYHGPLEVNGLEQPTAVATSTNGRNFTLGAMVLETEYADNASPYRTSTSYMKMVKHGGLYRAIWQGTTGRSSVVNGVSYGPIPTGYATSPDGLTWVKHNPIIVGNSGDQGLFAPGIVKLTEGWLIVGSYRTGVAGSQVQSVKAFFGETLERMRPIGDIILPGEGRLQSVNSPSFHMVGSKLYMVAGARNSVNTTPRIIAFELEW